jgi:hypothetical protein
VRAAKKLYLWTYLHFFYIESLIRPKITHVTWKQHMQQTTIVTGSPYKCRPLFVAKHTRAWSGPRQHASSKICKQQTFVLKHKHCRHVLVGKESGSLEPHYRRILQAFTHPPSSTIFREHDFVEYLLFILQLKLLPTGYQWPTCWCWEDHHG